MPKLRQWSTKRRALVAAATVVVLVLAGAGVWAATRPQPAPQERAIAARTTTLRQTLTTSGTIEPAQQSNLNFGASGQVTAVNAAVGEQVTQGQALATVSSASLAASVAEAKSALAADQAKLSSDQNASATSAQVDADQAAVTAAQNQLTTANNALAGATLTSPINGTVAAVNLTVGQQVAAGGSSSGATSGGSSGAAGSSGASGGSSSGSSGRSSGGQSSGGQSSGQAAGGATGSSQDTGSGSSATSSTAQIVVISSGSYIVNATVDDTQVGQVKPGNAVEITPNGATEPVLGAVSTVGMLSNSSSVPSYPVTITVTGNPPGLFAGAGAQVAIVVKEVSGAVVVPAAAVHYANGAAFVFQNTGGQRGQHPVSVGMTEGGQIQITNGLSAGDDVLVPASTAGARGSGTGAGQGGGRGGGLGGFGGGGFGGGGRGGSGGSGAVGGGRSTGGGG